MNKTQETPKEDCTYLIHMTPTVRDIAKSYAAMAGKSLNQYIVDLIMEDARKGIDRLQELIDKI